ncbi:hypothetical protein ABT297_31215 [Dactylosporangium sp. NPDC000555]|uniref:hypothetical protein n=1 Tax=Dactylosporangium sp. NPDC000555 TaxID=3154260 RepID=UPI00332DC424
MLDGVQIELAGRIPLQHAELVTRYIEDQDTLLLDTRSLRWASPLELAALVTIGTDAAHQGRDVRLQLPYDEKVTSYLGRMNVIDLLEEAGCKFDGSPLATGRRDRRDTLFEVTKVTTADSQQVAERLGEMAFGRLGRKAGAAAFKAMSELLDNATTHGVSDVGAFTAAQLLTGVTSNWPGFAFTVCDAGVGIFEHLRASAPHQDLVDSRAALERALQHKVSGVPGGNRRGYGLGDLGKYARSDGGGRLIIRSNGAVASVVLRSECKINYSTFTAPMNGTWASLRVRRT